MKLTPFTGGFVRTNAYLLETTGGNILIDAPSGVAEWLDGIGVRLDHLLLTHQHYDHVEDVKKLAARGAKVHAHSGYSKDLTLESAARDWGLPIVVEPYEVNGLLAGKDTLALCGHEFRLSHIPGHAVDSLAFHVPAYGMVFSGDTLFAGSIGRTDLPNGDTRQLLDGIDRHLMTLPENTKVYPGHGPATTIGSEKSGNPYL